MTYPGFSPHFSDSDGFDQRFFAKSLAQVAYYAY
jgi:hypothetical protein